jgi:hypothetical protein
MMVWAVGLPFWAAWKTSTVVTTSPDAGGSICPAAAACKYPFYDRKISFCSFSFNFKVTGRLSKGINILLYFTPCIIAYGKRHACKR